MSDPGSSAQDRPNRIPWPPLLYAITLLAAYILQRVLPLPPLFEAGIARFVGGASCVLGLAIGMSGIAQFRKVGTPVDPTGRATTIATGGIYGWTRNPMYLSGVLVGAGLALAWPSTWLLALVPVMAMALFKLAIEREEAFLERRFGEDYRAYKARVRRWI